MDPTPLTPFDRSKPKLPQIITFTSTPNTPRFSSAPLLGSRPSRVNLYTKKFIFLFKYLCSFLGIAHSKNGSADFRHLYVKRRGLLQGSAFWGSHRHHCILWGRKPPKTPKWGPGIGVSSLNKITDKFGTVERFQLSEAWSTRPDKGKSTNIDKKTKTEV